MRLEAKEENPIPPSSRIPIKYTDVHHELLNPFHIFSQDQKSLIESFSRDIDHLFNIFKEEILIKKFNKKVENKNSNQLFDREELKKLINHMIKMNDVALHKNEISNIDKSWLIYRFYQILDYYAYDLVNRYQDIEVIVKSNKTKSKIKHDLLDFFYIIQGLLEGGLATSENNIKKIWDQFANPGSCLIFLKDKEIEITIK